MIRLKTLLEGFFSDSPKSATTKAEEFAKKIADLPNVHPNSISIRSETDNIKIIRFRTETGDKVFVVLSMDGHIFKMSYVFIDRDLVYKSWSEQSVLDFLRNHL